MFVTIDEYAKKVGVVSSTIRNAIRRNYPFVTIKVNNRILIDDSTPYITSKTGYKYAKHPDRKRLKSIWHAMKKRCYNVKLPCYKNYGGRGITICDEWKNSFDLFMEWALSNGYRYDLQIDRINNDGNYEPNNCRFVTPKQNAQNRRPRITPEEKEANQATWKRNHFKLNVAHYGLKAVLERTPKEEIESGFYDDVIAEIKKRPRYEEFYM